MINILYIIGFVLLFNGIYQLVKYLFIISEVRSGLCTLSTQTRKGKTHKFIILSPVLHEEKTIKTFLTGLSLQDYPKDLYTVFIVTTQKEYSENRSPNTIDILNEMVSERRFSEIQLTILHYPDSKGFKTHQLDFAFKEIRKEYSSETISDSYFLFLDADSEVDRNMLAKFNNSIEENIEIYQQPLLWFKNIKEIRSPFMQSFAFLQSFFSISYEIPMFIGRFFPWRLKYFVGHGLCVKGSFLLRVGGFPDVIEDVRLGRLGSFLDIEVKLVPGFGIVETAKSLSVYIKQSSVWFFGCGLFISDYLHARSLRRTSGVGARDFVLLNYGIFKALRWLNKGLIHLVGLVISTVYSSLPMFALFLTSLLVSSLIPVLLVSRDLKCVWRKELSKRNETIMLFRSILFSPILYMLNFIGLYYGLGKLLKFYLWGEVTLPKTER